MEETLALMRRVERAYRCLSRCHRLIIGGLDEHDLLQRMCALAVDDAGYRLAWVGYANHDATRSVRPVAVSGAEVGYLDHIDVSWSDTPAGRGPTGTAIRSGEPSVAQNILTDPRYEPWRAAALQRGYGSSVALPLRDGALTFGALNLYAREPDAFDAAELELLCELGADLAHGIRYARGKVRLTALDEALRRSAELDAVGRVAAGIAHDINNMLAVIGVAVIALREELPATGAHVAHLRHVEDAAARAARLNREVLCFARGAPAPAESILADPVLGELWPLVRPGGAITAELALGAGGVRVALDPQSFERVVTNLVVNAREAMPAGGSLRVATARRVLEYPLPAGLSALVPGEYFALEVRDTGVGMNEGAQAHIFEPFFTTREGGSGLGLAIVFGLVRKAGGGIAVTSKPGAGTTFEVFLPRVG